MCVCVCVCFCVFLCVFLCVSLSLSVLSLFLSVISLCISTCTSLQKFRQVKHCSFSVQKGALARCSYAIARVKSSRNLISSVLEVRTDAQADGHAGRFVDVVFAALFQTVFDEFCVHLADLQHA